MKKTTLILLSVAILGIAIVTSQVIKQNQFNRELEYQKEKDRRASDQAFTDRVLLEECTGEADEKYWDYMRLNGTTNEDGSIWANQYVWDNAQKGKDAKLKECYSVYK